MPSQMTNSGVRDNHKRGVVADFLKVKIRSGYGLTPEEIKIVEGASEH
jgi:hypothetical protein